MMIPLGHTASLPWGDRPYSHFSDQEPLADMLTTLAANEKTPIVVSPQIKQVISAHFKSRSVKSIFDEVAKTQGLIWYYDKETLYVYKEDEVKTGSVSLQSLTPHEFIDALKRLDIYDDKFKWEVSEVDNLIKLTGPDRLISTVIDNAKLMDSQASKEKRIYKWKDANGKVHYSSDRPPSGNWDVKVNEKYPGVVVLDVVPGKK
ncbi:DUF4124 domain-containing protein [Thiofilum flexile]|uniref:DUF4124 domain-containing protein n=1 Tax=Thiofilum flexile TaxID=125627 RepID=UPI0013A53F6C|nr:DUF4124 domain-containing protein [Thiofilum flexile]